MCFGPSLASSATIAAPTPNRAITASSEIGWRMRNGSRRRAWAGSVRMTAVASPVEVPERAASMASASSRSATSDGTSA